VNDQVWVLVALLVAVLAFWLGSRSSSWKSQAAESLLQQALAAQPIRESLEALTTQSKTLGQTMEHLDGLIGAQVTLLQRGAHLRGVKLDDQVRPSNLDSGQTFPPGLPPAGSWGERERQREVPVGRQPTTLGRPT
jgi:lipopolysaccharide export LptBFGC system permease protein LptF